MALRHLDYHRVLTGPLDFKDGVLSKGRRHSAFVSAPKPTPPVEVSNMNQTELMRELREMHMEQLELQKSILEVLQALAITGVQATISGVPSLANPQTSVRSGPTVPPIEMDESVVVTAMDTSSIEKNFDTIADENIKKDAQLASSKDKLRALKGK